MTTDELIRKTIERVIKPEDSDSEKLRKIFLIEKLALLKNMQSLDYLIKQMEKY